MMQSGSAVTLVTSAPVRPHCDEGGRTKHFAIHMHFHVCCRFIFSLMGSKIFHVRLWPTITLHVHWSVHWSCDWRVILVVFPWQALVHFNFLKEMGFENKQTRLCRKTAGMNSSVLTPLPWPPLQERRRQKIDGLLDSARIYCFLFSNTPM